jgi:hypothetical protein
VVHRRADRFREAAIARARAACSPRATMKSWHSRAVRASPVEYPRAHVRGRSCPASSAASRAGLAHGHRFLEVRPGVQLHAPPVGVGLRVAGSSASSIMRGEDSRRAHRARHRRASCRGAQGRAAGEVVRRRPSSAAARSGSASSGATARTRARASRRAMPRSAPAAAEPRRATASASPHGRASGKAGCSPTRGLARSAAAASGSSVCAQAAARRRVACTPRQRSGRAAIDRAAPAGVQEGAGRCRAVAGSRRVRRAADGGVGRGEARAHRRPAPASRVGDRRPPRSPWTATCWWQQAEHPAGAGDRPGALDLPRAPAARAGLGGGAGRAMRGARAGPGVAAGAPGRRRRPFARAASTARPWPASRCFWRHAPGQGPRSRGIAAGNRDEPDMPRARDR